MDNINLEILPKDGDRLLQELAAGNMVITRSKNDFLYIVDFNGQFHLFSHTPGAPGGGQRQFPEDEQYTAMVSKLADLADAVYMAEYDKGLNIYGVMYTAEEAILSMFPGEGSENDAMIDFTIPEQQ